jgi:hypothetical protein
MVQPLLKRFYSVPNEPSSREDVEAQAVSCTPPELLDLLDIGLGQTSLHDDDSPCVRERPGKCRRPNHYRVPSRPRDIRKLDYGLPEGFGEGIRDQESLPMSLTTVILAVPGSDSGHVGLEARARGSSPDLDEFAFIIPLGCRTSTPLASMKQGLKEGVGLRHVPETSAHGTSSSTS